MTGRRASRSEYSSEDDSYLLDSIQLSEYAASAGNYPFAALLVDASGSVVVEAQNTVATDRDGTAHAEINLVRAATALLDSEALSACTLYVSAEPCAMCAAAICWVGIGRVVHSLSCEALARIVDEAGAAPVLEISCREVFSRSQNHVNVVGPHREEESRAVHDGFWRAHKLAVESLSRPSTDKRQEKPI